MKYESGPINSKVTEGWLVFYTLTNFKPVFVYFFYRGRVFLLEFATMRVCDLEFDCVRRLTTPPCPLPVPAANPNSAPSCHTVWKYYCRDNFGWREYSEVRFHVFVFPFYPRSVNTRPDKFIFLHTQSILAAVMGSSLSLVFISHSHLLGFNQQ